MHFTALSLLVLLYSCLAIFGLKSHTKLGRIKVSNKWMVDEFNRVRIFHGFNSVSKQFPWYCESILNTTRLSLLEEWGFNVVRVGLMWSGCEPFENKYNYTYWNTMQDIVKHLESHGMYTIFDVHQDVLSSKFDAYDGIPRWLINKFSSSSHLYPWPLGNVTKFNWALGYLTEAVSHAFQQLYDNAAEAVHLFSRFWQLAAARFRTFDSILGYELINEPWAGNIYKHPSLLLPGIAGKKNLLPLYNSLVAAIRSVDNETLVFYEPVTWGVMFNGEDSGSGFDNVPGGPDQRNLSVFSYHFYCWLISEGNSYQPYPLWKRVVCDTILGSRVIPTVMRDISKIGGSSFLTEFGICEPDGDPSSVDTIECLFVLDQADKYFQSWTYWDPVLFKNDGQPNYNVIKILSRAYPRATAGEPLALTFDMYSKVFYFKFVLNINIQQPTEIFLPKLHYQSGFNVSVSEGLSWTYDKASSVLFVTNSHIHSSQAVFVRVTPVDLHI